MNKYLNKNKNFYKLESNFEVRTKYSGAIIIPVLAELTNIEKTLKFIALNNEMLLSKTLIIIVINNSQNCSKEDFNDNQKLITLLHNSQFATQKKINLSWIDASSEGYEIINKPGVGSARKIGMDIALKYLDERGILFSLDADTEVENNYLQKGYDFYQKNKNFAGAIFNFYHRRIGNIQMDSAIEQYEQYLHLYVNELKRINSPYAYHSIGSTITCTVKDYIRAGGMKRHPAGEDFYFLQALRKVGAIGEIKDSTVYPSLRISDRTPFGTGQQINKILNGEKLVLYKSTTFDLLNELFELINTINLDNFKELDSFIKKNMKKPIIIFLDSYNFNEIWNKIYRNTPKKTLDLQKAFFTWFDAFKTIKFIHFIEK